MRLVDFEGTLNLSLLARYAAEPVLGPDRGDDVVLDRPVTRFLVLTDAEKSSRLGQIAPSSVGCCSIP